MRYISSKFPKLVFTLPILFLCIINTHAQKHYRLKEISNVSFLLPPKAKLGKEGLFCGKQSFQFHEKFRYHRVFIKNLTGNNYDYFKEAITKARHEHDHLKITPSRLENYYGASGSAVTLNSSAMIYFSKNNDGFVLEMDYNTIMSGDAVTYFKDLYAQLLDAFRTKETAAPIWPSTICQDIVGKIYELLPVPAASSLAGIGLVQTPAHSMLLLHPKISLRVDHAVLDDRTVISREGPATEPDWKYLMTGQSLIHLQKVQRSDGLMYFRQLPFLHNDLAGTPQFDNTYKETFVHLASSGDIQLSKGVSASKFMFLFQRYFKGNNSESKNSDDDGIENCCRSYGGRQCTSLILFRDDVTMITAPADYCEQNIRDYASFGERSLIVPVIPVYIDNSLTYQPLGIKLSDLVDAKLITVVNKLQREGANGYTVIDKKHNHIWMLPGDRVTNL